MRLELLSLKERSGLLQVKAFSGKAERLENGDDSACRFRDRCILHEEDLPDGVGLFSLRKLPVALGRHIRRTKELGLKVVVGQKLVDSPQSEAAEYRGKQMRVNVDEWSRGQYVLYNRFDLTDRQSVCLR